MLKKVIAKSFMCKFCKHAKGTINILEHMGGRKGRAECIIFICNYCSKESVMCTSKKVNGGSSTFDVNLCFPTFRSRRFGYVFLCDGFATTSTATIIPENQNKEKLASESKQLAETSMKESAQRLINVTMEKNPENIDIQVDGTMLL